MIRYLEKSEFGACRPLWQEAFPEDSREFADYYFDKKLCQSAVLVKEDDTGRIVTMAHMNHTGLMWVRRCGSWIISLAWQRLPTAATADI